MMCDIEGEKTELMTKKNGGRAPLTYDFEQTKALHIFYILYRRVASVRAQLERWKAWFQMNWLRYKIARLSTS